MNTTPRRALRLASALVAAGLTLSAVPAVAMADDSRLLVLSDSQAESLEQRAQIDAYATADSAPVGTGETTAADSGSHSSLDEETGTSAAGVAINPRATLEGHRGLGVTTAVGGSKSDYFSLHSLGTVQRRTEDGTTVWRRDNASLYADWQVTPTRAYQVEPNPARIVMGFNAVSPFTAASDQGYATADLTGDGVDDVVFTASVGITPYRPFTSPGSTLPNGTFVTVLDGKSGKTLWSKLYADVFNVTVVGKTLIVADSPYYNLNSPRTQTATLTGIRFSYTSGALTPTDTWTHDTGARVNVAWGGLEDIGGGLLAASWNQRKTSATAASRSRTLVLDTTDGHLKWSTDSALYSRQLHRDAARGRVVALEQSDLSDGMQYALAAYDPETGERTTLDTRANALPLGLTLGDVRGDRRPEYLVSESTLDSALFINSNSVRALNGSDPSTVLWSHTVKRAEDNSKDGGGAWGIKVVDGKVIASYQVDEHREDSGNPGSSREAALTVLSGNDGAVRWEQRGVVASQLYAQPVRISGDWRIRTVDTDQNIRTYSLGGTQKDIQPLQGDLSSAVVVDVNGDKKNDLVLGGQSNGVWAYDGPSLVAGKPELLWQSTMPGQIHQLAKADTNGDGRDEIVVAADSAAVVLQARDGKTLSTIDGKGRFIRSVTTSDLDADRKAEVLVPTDKVRAYTGSGKELWEYAAPAAAGDVVFSDVTVADGRVHTQYASRGAYNLETPAVAALALRARDGKPEWTAVPKAPEGTNGKVSGAVLLNGVFTSPEIPFAHGHAVVHAWTTYDTAPRTFMEIRDARTGEVLLTDLTGGISTVGNWFTGPEGLVLAGTASLRTYSADQKYKMYTLPTLQSAGFATGPDGRRVLIAGVEAGLYAYDPGILVQNHNYPAALDSLTLQGARNFCSGDLDGDGKDEVVSLNFDESGYDRMTELSGARYLLQNSGIHQATITTLDAS
ncbi:VCBS repeat-containing protein [Streptomyces sp. A0642]|uniref:FG-GAP repeat domain-containing protein n=1 Tax=Streptomyces sp. A0642 TaxID=2563100 RepID=UPI0014454D41|nr:VCBS repeat-containing protein [Streptomyces sp. A0642]